MSMAIPIDELRKTDLSLFVYFIVLLEEKTIAKAAKRLELSQPALTRAIHRLRDVFHDDLLVRSDDGYRPTTRGQELLSQLAIILPRIDDVIAGKPFDPATAETNFNITAADSLSYFFAPILAKKHKETPGTSFTFSTYSEARFDDLETNTQDLVLDARYKVLAKGLRSEVLFEDTLVCAVARKSSFPVIFDLEAYLAVRHVAITTLHDIQAIPDLAFARDGLKRQAPFRVPSFAAALGMVVGSDLVATVPLSLAALLIDPATTRLVRAPAEVKPYQYVMIWHRRQENDQRHIWLREAFRSATKDLVVAVDQKVKASALMSW